MKLGILTIAYREQNYIGDCIKQFASHNVRHLVLISETPWWGERTELDDTELIATQKGAEVIVSSWKNEQEQRNFGMEWLKDCDWILVIDADERYSEESVKRLKIFLERADKPAYGINTIYTYWKDWNHRIEPKENGGLIVAVRPNVRFTYLRCIDSIWDFLPKEIVMHHGSYVRTNEEMTRKCKQLKFNNELLDGWYENKWLGWDKDNSIEDLHPCNGISFKRTKYVEHHNTNLFQ
jgi:glycosyltransferase involved in cell wall biosynthesis